MRLFEHLRHVYRLDLVKLRISDVRPRSFESRQITNLRRGIYEKQGSDNLLRGTMHVDILECMFPWPGFNLIATTDS